MTQALTLADFGWTAHFQSQLALDEIAGTVPARVVAVHRGALELMGPGFARRAPPLAAATEEAQATVGDWLLLDAATGRPRRRLDRVSLFKRRAAGTPARLQLIAANVDTLFLVSSCNEEFNIARLERYLALAREAGAVPVIVLTKADLATDTEEFAAAARRLMPGLNVETLDARHDTARDRLGPWVARGQTIALLGSSGVGKSTLLNTLAGEEHQATGSIREDDAKGRHTTTARVLHRLGCGAWLIDTPGMRELQLADAQSGIRDLYADIEAFGRACRFADCAHEAEPGCAVQAAAAAGVLDPQRIKRRAKLLREEARNTESVWQRNRRARSFARQVRSSMRDKREIE
jgi:ribosome biogenesis GTPase